MGTNADLADLGELGRFVVAEVKKRQLRHRPQPRRVGALLHARADAIGQGQLPPHHNL